MVGKASLTRCRGVEVAEEDIENAGDEKGVRV
jgi:hypothetical protein